MRKRGPPPRRRRDSLRQPATSMRPLKKTSLGKTFFSSLAGAVVLARVGNHRLVAAAANCFGSLLLSSQKHVACCDTRVCIFDYRCLLSSSSFESDSSHSSTRRGLSVPSDPCIPFHWKRQVVAVISMIHSRRSPAGLIRTGDPSVGRHVVDTRCRRRQL